MPRCHTNAAGSDRDCPARIVPPLRLVDAGVTEHQLDRAEGSRKSATVTAAT
jgi:hypothetical protein